MSDVVVTRRGVVEVIELHRPERGNAIGGTLMKDVLEAAEAADADSGVRAILSTGSGRAYCVGADRSEMADLAAHGPIDLGRIGVNGIGGDKGLEPLPAAQDRLGIGRWTLRFLALRKPTVAALNGGAGGGGLAIALLHDVRIAAAGVNLAFGWSAIGLGPEMGVSWILPRLVGGARAFELLTRSAPITAEQALELGLVEQVVPAEELIEAASTRAEQLAAISADAYAAIKRLVRVGGQDGLEEQLEREWSEQTRLFGTDRVSDFLRGMPRAIATEPC